MALAFDPINYFYAMRTGTATFDVSDVNWLRGKRLRTIALTCGAATSIVVSNSSGSISAVCNENEKLVLTPGLAGLNGLNIVVSGAAGQWLIEGLEGA